MDKQLIEELAETAYEEAMGQSLRPQDRHAVISTCVNFLTRIDAERGKEAVAWRVLNRDFKDTLRLTESTVDTAYLKAEGYTCIPLFLSPTIPEGMAKDAERYRFIRMNRLWLKANLNLIAAPALDEAIDSAMLAAAQGERNAD